MRVVRPADIDRRLIAGLGGLERAAAVLAAALAFGCPGGAAIPDAGRLSWTLSPDPPRIGPAVFALSLVDLASRPVVGARWQLEGQMTHPGMRPAVAEVTPVAAGRYEARLSFSMAGDWVVLARADWGEGQRLERIIPVRVGP